MRRARTLAKLIICSYCISFRILSKVKTNQNTSIDGRHQIFVYKSVYICNQYSLLATLICTRFYFIILLLPRLSCIRYIFNIYFSVGTSYSPFSYLFPEMLAVYSVIILILIIIIIRYKWKRRILVKMMNQFPGPPMKPIFGNAFNFSADTASTYVHHITSYTRALLFQ